MNQPQPTRAQLIAQIEASSKDAVVLAEMQRLGFWPSKTEQPSIQDALIQRETELVQALQGLQSQLKLHTDPAAALKAMHKERMQAAKDKREATAQAKEKNRFDRALRWHENRPQYMGYLGSGVSSGLHGKPKKPSNINPSLHKIDTPQALAQAMGITPPELKFLCFHREVARTTHYRRFALPKKTGGQRIISAPMPRLKRAQYWVLDQLLSQVPCHSAAHGFIKNRSIVTNAAPHCDKAVVINLDLQNFFPSIAYPRIKGVFQHLGYHSAVATVLALLCSENVADELTVDGQRFFVGSKARERRLPQGAPTSPMITNILCQTLDRRLHGAAQKLGFTYTRYADDLTFSAAPESAHHSAKLRRQVHHIVKTEGFTPHPTKEHIMRSGCRREVTGVVVNNTEPTVSRQKRRQLRAALHRAQTQGIASATWQNLPASRAALVGYAQFAAMVNATQGQALLAKAKALPGDTSAPRPSHTWRQAAGQGLTPNRRQGPWWQPKSRPAPQLQLTALQLKTARLERIKTKKEGRPPPASNLPPENGNIDPTFLSTATQKSNLPWIQFGAQTLGMLTMAMLLSSPIMLVVGSCWMGFCLHQRKFGWLPYLISMGIMTMFAMGR
jgi:RNA-directed DNA polymerase